MIKDEVSYGRDACTTIKTLILMIFYVLFGILSFFVIYPLTRKGNGGNILP